MDLSALTAISPVDGRYHKESTELSPFFSEQGLMRTRLLVELTWWRQIASRLLARRIRK